MARGVQSTSWKGQITLGTLPGGIENKDRHCPDAGKGRTLYQSPPPALLIHIYNHWPVERFLHSNMARGPRITTLERLDIAELLRGH